MKADGVQQVFKLTTQSAVKFYGSANPAFRRVSGTFLLCGRPGVSLVSRLSKPIRYMILAENIPLKFRRFDVQTECSAFNHFVINQVPANVKKDQMDEFILKEFGETDLDSVD